MTRTATPADVLSGAARWCVVEGDALAVLAALPDGAVDHVVTDPPYDEKTHANVKTTKGGNYEVVRVSLQFAPIDPKSITSALLRAARRWVVAFCSAEMVGGSRDAAGKAWVRAGFWRKPSSMPQLTGDRPAVGGEAVSIMHRPGRKTWNGGGRAAFWSCDVERGDGRAHPTQKPLPLMRELVRDFTDPGDVILDPFAGSGTTGVAALAEGRRVILCERVPEYAEIARRRCEAAAQGTDWRVDPRQLSLLGGGE